MRVKVTNHFLPGSNTTQLTKKYGKDIPDLTTSKYYELSDFVNDARNIYPKLDISKDINMMGNYFDQDPSKMKAYTEVMLKINWYETMKAAKDLVNKYLYFISTSSRSNLYDPAIVQESTCSKAYVAPDTEYVLRKNKMMDDFTVAYTQKNGKTAYDSDYVLAYKTYEKQVDAALDAEKAAQEKKLAAEDPQYSLYQSLAAELEIDYTKCYTVSYSNTTVFNYRFEDLHKDQMMNIVNGIKDGIVVGSGQFGSAVFDAILPQIYKSGYMSQYTVGQAKPDFDCFNKINPSTKHTPQMCTSKTHILEFMVREDYVQDIFVYNSKNNQVQTRKKLSNTLAAGDFKSISHIRYQKFPALNQMPSDNFDSIFNMVFTLSPQVIAGKEIWMVQNQTTPRTSTMLAFGGLNLAERVATTKKSNFFEILAFTGGLWFFLSQLVLGPISRKAFSNQEEETTSV